MVDVSRVHPWLVLALSIAVSIGAADQAARNLAVDTNPDLLSSPELSFRQTNAALESAFPNIQHNLVVMVDGPDGATARAAAEELAALLEADTENYVDVFLPGDDPFYEDNGLLYMDIVELRAMQTRIEKSGPLLASLAERPELPILIAALNHVIGSEEGLASLGDDGGRILDHFTLAVQRNNDGERAAIAWDDLLFEDIDGSWDDLQIIFVKPSNDMTELEPGMAVITRIRELAAELTPREGVRVRVTGDQAVHTEEMSLVFGEAIAAGGASLLLVTLILFYSLKSFRLMFATVLTLMVGLVWTAGLAGLAVGHLNVLTSAFAVLYIGLGVDFGIHFALGYLEQRTLGLAPAEALHGTGRTVGSSLLFCALTTAIGFYAFIPTSYAGVAELGIISGSGVFLGLIATLTFYPALISLGLGESRKLTSSPLHNLRIRLPQFPIVYPRTVCLVTLAIVVASLACLPSIRFDMDPLNVRDPRVESVVAMKDLLADGEIAAWTIELLAENQAEAQALAARLEALDGIKNVHVPDSFLPSDEAERLAIFDEMRRDLSEGVELTNDERGEGLDPFEALKYTIEGYGVALDIDADLRGEPSDGSGVDAAELAGGGPSLIARAERLRVALETLRARIDAAELSGDPFDLSPLESDVFGELPDVLDGVKEALPTDGVEFDELPSSLIDRYVAPDGRVRVEIFSSRDLNQRGELERFTDLVRAVHEEAGGSVISTVELGRAIVDSLRQALATAAIVITLLLAVLWRSTRYVLITLAPLTVGALLTAAFTVVTDMPFNFANVIVLPLILGIGVDSGIHLVHRHRLGLLGSKNLLTTSTASAVLFSALTTIGSFGTLGLSNHLGISSLATMLVVGVFLMLVANVVVLPAILTWLDPPPRLPAGVRHDVHTRASSQNAA